MALCKNTKNVISDESYIKSLIENIEVGLMISSVDEPVVPSNVDDTRFEMIS